MNRRYFALAGLPAVGLAAYELTQAAKKGKGTGIGGNKSKEGTNAATPKDKPKGKKHDGSNKKVSAGEPIYPQPSIATPQPGGDDNSVFCAACAADTDCATLDDGTQLVCRGGKCGVESGVCNDVFYTCGIGTEFVCDDNGARCRNPTGKHPRKHKKRRYSAAYAYCDCEPPTCFNHTPDDTPTATP